MKTVLCLLSIWVTIALVAEPEEMVSLQFPNSPVDSILAQYESLTGKHILRGPNLNGPNIYLVVKQVPKSEAVRLIEAVLLLNGYSLVPGSDNSVKVINIGVSQKAPKGEGIPLFTQVADLPASDQVVSFFLPLTYLDPEKAQQLFQSQGGQNTYSLVTPVKDAHALVLTDNTSVIRQLIKLKELVDVPPAKLTKEFVQLKRADAERVAKLISGIIQGRRENKISSVGQALLPNPPSNTSVPTPANVNAGTANLGEANYLSGDIQLIADSRTNRILVICSPDVFTYIRDLIEEFDSVINQEKPFVRSLKYIASADVLPVLGDLLSEEDKDVKSSTTSTGSRTSASKPATTSSGSTGTSSSSGTVPSKPDVLGSPDDDQAPISLIVGKTRLIADKRANAIIIIGSPEHITKVSGFLDELDVKPRQVLLSTVIGQLSLEKDQDFGVDILQNFKHSVASQSQTAAGSSNFLDPRSLTSAAAFPFSGTGLMLYGAFGNSINAYVRALETVSNFKVLSRPSIFTSNNKKAVIVSGSNQPIPGQTITDVTSGNTTSNVDYKDVVLKLEVIPLINSDNEITLQIAQQNDSITSNVLISGNSIPVISTQSVTTTVELKNNHTVILGGLIQDTAQKTETGVPYLKDIPLVGNLFKETGTKRPRTELVVMIQPQVVSDQENKELDRYMVGPESKTALESPYPYQTQMPKGPESIKKADPVQPPVENKP